MDFLSSSFFEGCVYALDVLTDGTVVIGGGDNVVIAHNPATEAVLWRKEMHGKVWSLSIDGGLVFIPVDGTEILVLDVTSGVQVHTLPLTGVYIRQVLVFDGL